MRCVASEQARERLDLDAHRRILVQDLARRRFASRSYDARLELPGAFDPGRFAVERNPPRLRSIQLRLGRSCILSLHYFKGT